MTSNLIIAPDVRGAPNIVVTNEFLDAVSELVDEVALDKPLDFEKYNWEAQKKLAILETCETYFGAMDADLGVDGYHATIVAIMSYLLIENMILWTMIQENKKGI